jgi:hypothetical protein
MQAPTPLLAGRAVGRGLAGGTWYEVAYGYCEVAYCGYEDLPMLISCALLL